MNALSSYPTKEKFEEYAPVGATSVIEGIKYKKHEDGNITSEIKKKNDHQFCNIL